MREATSADGEAVHAVESTAFGRAAGGAALVERVAVSDGSESSLSLVKAHFLALPLAARDPSIRGTVVYRPAWSGV